MDRENFPKGEDRKLAGRTTREPIEPRYALTESADPVVKRGRPVPSVERTETEADGLSGVVGRACGGKLHWETREISSVAGDDCNGSV